MGKARDYQKEYLRRTANAEKRGLSRSQARGHARIGETQIRPTTAKDDDRFEAALRLYRQTGNQSASARAMNLASERLRRFLRENVQIAGRGRSLQIIDNRHRDMTVISDGKAAVLRLHDFDQASLNGQHLSAVGEFIRTNDRELLLPFDGSVVIDAKGRPHSLETDPNELHRVAAQGDELFHEIYRLVLKGD